MAVQDFPNGGFIGKLGQLVGQRRGSEFIIRTWVKGTDPKTPSQIVQRDRFRLASTAASASQSIAGRRGYWNPQNFDERQKFQGFALRQWQTPNYPMSGCWLVPPGAGDYDGLPLGVSVSPDNMSIQIVGGDVLYPARKAVHYIGVCPVNIDGQGRIGCFPFSVPAIFSGYTGVTSSDWIALSQPYMPSLPVRVVALSQTPVGGQQFVVLDKMVDVFRGSGPRSWGALWAYEQLASSINNNNDKNAVCQTIFTRAMANQNTSADPWVYIDCSGIEPVGPAVSITNVVYDDVDGVCTVSASAPGRGTEDTLEIIVLCGGQLAGQSRYATDGNAEVTYFPGGQYSVTARVPFDPAYLAHVERIYILAWWGDMQGSQIQGRFGGQVLVVR